MNNQGSKVKEPKPSGQVSSEIDAMFNQLEELHSVIDSLEERLTSVIKDRDDIEVRGTAEERHKQVPLADTLGERNSKLAFATHRLINIKDRIEL